KDHLAAMLGVGRLDAAIDLLKEDIKTTRLKIETLGSVQIDPIQMEESVRRKRGEIETIHQEETARHQELGRVEQEIKAGDGRVEELRRKEQAFNELERKKSALRERRDAGEKTVNRLTQELAEIEKSADRLEALKKATAGLETLRNQVQSYRQAEIMSREKARLENEKKGLEKSLAEQLDRLSRDSGRARELETSLAEKGKVIRSLEDAEKEREKLVIVYRDLNADLKVAEKKLADLDEQKRQIGQLGPDAVCQSCLRPFGEELPEIEKHFDQEIGLLKGRLETLGERLERVKKDGVTLAGQIETFKKEQERLNRLESEWASVKAGVAAAGIYIREGQERLTGIDKRLAEIGAVAFEPAVLAETETRLRDMQNQQEAYIRLAERAARRPQLETELAQAGESLAAVDRESAETMAGQAALAFDDQANRSAQADLTASRDKASAIRLELERLAGGIRLLESETTGLIRQLEEYEKSKVEIGRLRESLTYLEKLSILFGEFRVFLIGRIRPTLSKQTSQLFYEMTGGRYQEVELDEDYNLCLYDRGELFPSTRFSGGEIDLLNLCFRLAISVTMAETAGIDQSFIILDEIFGSQDRERQQLIIEGLNRLKSRFRQIIIISHIEEVKEMSEHIMSVEVDGSGTSRAVMSEAV
ncbi:MAG: hypothetical protein PHR28_08275, partial [candidate division Zixibacteria bacterium]|nr:hypothetical protein [candidate division Zixibacteria bacterium]